MHIVTFQKLLAIFNQVSMSHSETNKTEVVKNISCIQAETNTNIFKGYNPDIFRYF